MFLQVLSLRDYRPTGLLTEARDKNALTQYASTILIYKKQTRDDVKRYC